MNAFAALPTVQPWLLKGKDAQTRGYLRGLGYPITQSNLPLDSMADRYWVGFFQTHFNRMVDRGVLGPARLVVDGRIGPYTRAAIGNAWDLMGSEGRAWLDVVFQRYSGFGGPLGPADARRVETVHTWTPAPVTLAQMGQTATAAADTYTLREWAARLATRAKPKDYRGQLEQLYRGIIGRWKYVLEDGEWIHGTPRSLLGTVLGADYNCCPTCPTAERCDVEKTKWRESGWGDCDDVSTLTAAGVLSLGMRPLWRVSAGSDGRAHVSVAAVTPGGEVVQLDPVGHPEHPFGWAQTGPGVSVQYHALDGTPLASANDFGAFGALDMQPARPISLAPQFYPHTMISPTVWQAAPYGFGSLVSAQGTYLGVLSRTRNGLTPYQGRVPKHFVAVAPGDTRGCRVLAVPGWHARAMMAGIVVDGCPAVDQYGGEYAYSQPLDLWVPRASRAANVAMYGFGATRAERKAKRKARRRRVGQKIKRVITKIGKGIRKVAAKILNSKFVQTIVAGIAQVWGFPMAAMKGLMTVAAKFVGSGGFIALFKKLRKDPKGALKTLAKTVAAAGRSDLLQKLKVPGFAGPATGYEPVVYELQQQGTPFYAAAVEGIVGLDGAMGDAGEGGSTFAESPTPGYRYQIRKDSGPNNLSDLAEAAFGKTLPGARWISAAKANQQYTRPAANDYERKYIGPRVLSFLPKFGPNGNEYAKPWIPPAEGVEPAVVPVIPDGSVPDIEDLEDDDDELDPGPVPVPPVPPVEPEDFEPEPGPPAPQPPPILPVVPVKPEPVPLRPDSVPEGMPPLGPVPGYIPRPDSVPEGMPPLGPVPGYIPRPDLPPMTPEQAHEAAHHEAAHDAYQPPYPPHEAAHDAYQPPQHPPFVVPSGPPRGAGSDTGDLGLALALASFLLT
jgi:hypothetical protein